MVSHVFGNIFTNDTNNCLRGCMYLRKRVAVVLAFFAFLSIYLSGCSEDKGYIEQQSFQMGTIITDKIYGEHAKAASHEIFERFRQIENNMSVNNEDSMVSSFNAQAGSNSVVELNADIIYILDTAKRFSELSDGAFDITIGPLVKEWGIMTDHPHVPTQQKINELLKLVDYRQIKVNVKDNTAVLSIKGDSIDLGAIAKGYAADEAVRICNKNGVKSAYINLGGNVSVIGSKPDGTPWKIGIQNPRGTNGKYIGVLSVSDKTVVTSGDYERFFEKNGIRYHHIIDPKTGYPSNSDIISVTIVTDKSIEADALSTAAFVMGYKKSVAMLKKLPGVEAIIITKDKKVHITEGLKPYFTFIDESGEFKYAEKG